MRVRVVSVEWYQQPWPCGHNDPVYRGPDGQSCAVCGVFRRACRSCVFVPDSFEVGEDGTCKTCKGTKVEPVETCDGCDYPQPDIQPYRVTFHDNGQADVHYCATCADLARMDWNGETRAIVPLNPTPEI